MLTTIIAVILTIIAAFRGWKGWAVLPIVITYGGSFLTGIIIGSTAASITEAKNTINSLQYVFIIVEVVEIIILIIMSIVGRKRKTAIIPNYPVNPVPQAVPSYSDYPNNPSDSPVNIQPASIQPPTAVISPTVVYRKSKLVSPDGNNIVLTEATKSLGRNDFEKSVPPNVINMISRQHLFIKYENGKYYIDDYSSANGTKLNSIDIKGKGWQELKDGDKITIAGVLDMTYKTGQ
jgi:hypothetical protein